MKKMSMTNLAAITGGTALVVMGVLFINNDTLGSLIYNDNSAAAVTSSQTLIAINANPTLVSPGGVSTLVWSTLGFQSCSLTGPGMVGSGVKGNRPTGPLTTASTFVITCMTKAGASASQSVTVGIIPKSK